MRLDKYLKVSRLIKRRTVANEACDAGRVSINGKPAKASADRNRLRKPAGEGGDHGNRRDHEEGRSQGHVPIRLVRQSRVKAFKERIL